MLPHLALLALAVAPLAHAATVELWWNISYVDGANPSGLQPRRVIGVNGSWPLPPVTVTQGDELIIHAYNGLPDAGTALHHHGLYFNGTSYYDGAVGVTQCAIPPGSTFDYHISTDLQYGTYWIHGHYNGQYVDGLRTPLIIQPNTTLKYPVDGDYTIVLGDWYNDQHSILMDEFMSVYNPTGAEPVPTAPVLWILPNNTFSTPMGTDIYDGSAVNDNASIRFEQGKTYRLRFINMAALAMFHLGLDGHNISVIELDGVETEPYPVETFQLSVAQRGSILVTARNDSEATQHDWPLWANMDPNMFDTVPDDLQMNVTARVSYTDQQLTVQNATIYDPDYPMFYDENLVPIEVMANAPADVSTRFDAYFDTYDDGTNRASFNNITYVSPKVPSIVTALTMPSADSFLLAYAGESNASYSKIYGAQTQAFAFSYMQNIEYTIYNWDAGFHPFHFQLLQKNYDASQGIPLNESAANPMRRDTVMVPPGGSATLRFRADNPGVWLMHCHIEWHLESGLAVVFIEAPEQAQSKLTLPQSLIDQCAAQNIATSGNVVGKNSTTDFSGQPCVFFIIFHRRLGGVDLVFFSFVCRWGPFTQWHLIGWTPKAKGALAGCVITALLGMFSIIWYSMNALTEEEVHAEQQRKFDDKMALAADGLGTGKIGKARRFFRKKN
ncbi:Cupredoxin [Clavulina sp. PMI_390]|nr:Cupredoxin [Clavulina sp. PMI_390]